MSAHIIKRLVLKDWYFNRGPLLIYLIIGFASLILFALENKTAFYMSSVLIVSIVIIIGIHLTMTTVIQERKNQTMAFVMSLPISFMQYTTAKLLSNLIGFLVLWSLLFVTILCIITMRAGIPNGLIPMATIFLLELLVANVLVLSVALITESEPWTIAVMSICNIGVSLFWFFVSSFAEISEYVEGESAVWNTTALSMVSIEILLAITFIAVTYWVQSRKKDFL